MQKRYGHPLLLSDNASRRRRTKNFDLLHFLGRIACNLFLPLPMLNVPWCVSVCWAYRWALQKRMDRSICRLGAESCGPKKDAHWRHLEHTTEWFVRSGDAALCQITLTNCLCLSRFWTVMCVIAVMPLDRVNLKSLQLISYRKIRNYSRLTFLCAARWCHYRTYVDFEHK